MKIVLVGASGIIGGHLARHFAGQHEIIAASRSNSAHKLDISSLASIRQFLAGCGNFDALISVAGSAPFKALEDLQGQDFEAGIASKMMGQINLVLEGSKYINSGGSFSLISGILAEDPIPRGSVLSTVNGALNSFVKSAARELTPKNIRLNIISPGLLEDSAENLGEAFPGHLPVSAQRVIKAFEKSLFGNGSGEVIRVY